MKLEVGMYVRTDNGLVRRLDRVSERTGNGIVDYGDWILRFTTNKRKSRKYGSELIVKASHNIIDLIEVGDVITFKNDNDVYKVICIPNKKHACDCFYLEFNYADKYGVEDIYVSKEDMEETLKSILTKQQFKANEYVVE